MTLSTTETAKTGLNPHLLLALWRAKKDTSEIALIMKVHESVVYNTLALMGKEETEPYRYSREEARTSFESWGGWSR
jgi:hypothetical protein